MLLYKVSRIRYGVSTTLSVRRYQWDGQGQRVEEPPQSNHPLWKSFLRENNESDSRTRPVIDPEMERKEMLIKGQLAVHRAIARCRWGGHIQAALDPLDEAREKYEEGMWLPKNHYGTAAFLPYSEQEIIRVPHNINLLGGSKKWLSVKQLLTKMKSIYSHSIGFEEMQQSWGVESWVARKLELRQQEQIRVKAQDTSSRMVTLRRLVQAHSLEDWLLTQHPELTSGLGTEILSIALQSLTDSASLYSAQHFNLCMSTTRGRLNVMLNAMRKPAEQVLAALEDFSLKGRYLDMSDRTSLGLNSSKVSSKSNDPLVLNLLANVSNYPDTQIALLQGKSRADRLFLRDVYGNKVWPIIIHGDRAVSSHGKVIEMLRLNFSSQYGHRGAMHIVISDQRQLGRIKSEMKVDTPYCTDVMKGVNAPVLHVNARDIDAVNFCIELAVEYKARFLRSAMVNLVCTPENKAKESVYFWKSVVENPFTQNLIRSGKTSIGILWRHIDSLRDLYTSKYNLREFNFMDWVDSPWKKSQAVSDSMSEPITGITSETLESGLKTFLDFGEKLDLHQSLKEPLDKRSQLASNGLINWTCAEGLAVCTLVKNRINVRLTGDEVLYPKSSALKMRLWRLEEMTSPTHRIFLDEDNTKANFTVSSVPGSMNTMLEYELGFTTANPRCMSIWQGSEGSLSRLQYLIDVYIAGGEVRWLRQTSLLMLFLINENEGEVWRKENCPWRLLCNTLDVANLKKSPMALLSKCHMIVMCPSTPANYFHALLRQVGPTFRKPAAVFISTQMFTSYEVLSDKQHFLLNNKFQTFIPDDSITDAKEVVRVILCCGSIYYKLVEERKTQGLQQKIAVCRVEQISPFPYRAVAQELERFPQANIVWAQLEPVDRAWYQYVKYRIESSSQNKKKCGFVGRQPSIYKDFKKDLTKNIINRALTL